MSSTTRELKLDAYQVAWVCALDCELNASKAMFDEVHTRHQPEEDENIYTLGRIGNHNVVMVGAGVGTNAAADAAANMVRSFPKIRFGLMVGVGGGVPKPPNNDPLRDIRLGDVVVSKPYGDRGGVVQYDKGKWVEYRQFQISGHLNKPPKVLLNAIREIQYQHGDAIDKRHMDTYINDAISHFSTRPRLKGTFDRPTTADRLFQADAVHPKREQEDCLGCDGLPTVQRRARNMPDPEVHYGLIASGNAVMRSARDRDELRDKEGVTCFEMEAAGLMDTFPCLVIRGICDYSDSHKNKDWQSYAALAAAAYAKDLLRVVLPKHVDDTPNAADRILPKPPTQSPQPPTVDQSTKSHQANCFVGLVRAADIDRILTLRRTEFKADLQKLLRALVGGLGDDFSSRSTEYQLFMDKYSLRPNWHWSQGSGNSTFDGFSQRQALEVATSPSHSDIYRLRAARANAFCYGNEDGAAEHFLVYDTIVRVWQYIDG
ncbi:nucleoside phosphorylase domain-containing protein [Aspergillus insuetus]